MQKQTFLFSTRDITEGGLMVGMALILNFLKIPVGATGGSINLQLLPLFIYSLRKGWFKGFIVSGIVYGLTTCIIDSSGNLANFPFDYFLGFGSCAIFGLFSSHFKKNKPFLLNLILFTICGVIATILRFIFSTMSSVFIYQYDLIPALAYNALYIPLSGIASTIVLVCLLKPLSHLQTED